MDTRGDDPVVAAGLRRAFYGDVDEDVAAGAIGLLGCDSPTAMATQATALTDEGWGSLPRTYVTCRDDRTIPLALPQLFIAEADEAFPDNPTAVVALASSHSPFLSMPGRVAEIVNAVA